MSERMSAIEDLSLAAVNTLKSYESAVRLPDDFFVAIGDSSDPKTTASTCPHPNQDHHEDTSFKLHRNLLRRRHVRKEQKVRERQKRDQEDAKESERPLRKLRVSGEKSQITCSGLNSTASRTCLAPPFHHISAPQRKRRKMALGIQRQIHRGSGVSLGRYHLSMSPSTPSTSPQMELGTPNSHISLSRSFCREGRTVSETRSVDMTEGKSFSLTKFYHL